MDRPRRIVIVAFDDAQSLDFAGPLEVFATAERLSPGRYASELGNNGSGQHGKRCGSISPSYPLKS